MATEYYFVSDLHLGGDGELRHCDFVPEFVQFLRELEVRGGEAELIIAGDTFGFWELTSVTGIAKLDRVIEDHPEIFAALRETGQKVRITLMAGNHDYDLACDPAFGSRLREYNIVLDPSVSVRREMLGRTIWVEHGQQADPLNSSPDYGNRFALPVGYFITETIVAGASRFSSFGRGNWLKDIRSVATEQIPDWTLSNYFYREMGWIIRAVLSVFLVLLTVTLVAMGAEALRKLGVLNVNVVLDNPFMRSLGFVGNVFNIVVFVNMIILFFMLVVAIPEFVVLHDIRTTLRRFQITSGGVAALAVQSNQPYLDRAQAVFSEHPDTAVYLFGHTHDAFVERAGDRVVVNLGTWLKILARVPVRFGYMPAVYYPSFRLNYVHVRAVGSQIVIGYVEIPKAPRRELTWLQRIVTLGKKGAARRAIPAETIIETAGTAAGSAG